jgi:hypothetical protein
MRERTVVYAKGSGIRSLTSETVAVPRSQRMDMTSISRGVKLSFAMKETPV